MKTFITRMLPVWRTNMRLYHTLHIPNKCKYIDLPIFEHKCFYDRFYLFLCRMSCWLFIERARSHSFVSQPSRSHTAAVAAREGSFVCRYNVFVAVMGNMRQDSIYANHLLPEPVDLYLRIWYYTFWNIHSRFLW